MYYYSIILFILFPHEYQGFKNGNICYPTVRIDGYWSISQSPRLITTVITSVAHASFEQELSWLCQH